ncbi:TonB-dependent receptor [Pseudomonas sp. RC3H12]|uniref:TonB-dependent receptor n=1 Tax=Pseudomonas TaxID=286 RepID=UPI002032A27B|nr:TonB-dependent receptor [Pseudomonas sp. RC3H12]
MPPLQHPQAPKLPRRALRMAVLLGMAAIAGNAFAQPPRSTTSAQQQTPDVKEEGLTLPETLVQETRDALGAPPPEYAGGQVGSGSRVGLMGNKDFSETPFNAISYTKEYIENRQAQDIGAVIGATDPSVYVPSKRGIFETFFIRGLYSTGNDITFNGLPSMAPNMRGSTELAERIEVLKGPSALLNGMPPDGSVGGSINIVPKRAGDDPLARLTASYESDGLAGMHADIGRRFGDQKQFGVRFNGVYRDGDTPVDDQQHRMQLSSLALDWRGERARASLDYYHQRERMDGVNYFGIASISPGVTHLPKAKKGDHSLAPEWGYTVNDTDTVVLRGEYDLNDSLTAFAGWGHREGGYNALMTSGMLLNDAGDISATPIRSARDGEQKSGEVGLRGRFATGPADHAWSLAATRYDSENSFKDKRLPTRILTNYYNLDYGPRPEIGEYGNVTSRMRARLSSEALLDTMSFLDDKVQWTVGARHQNVRASNYDGNHQRTSKPYDESRVSPATALLVKVTDELSLYGNYIEGLSQGGIAPDNARNAGAIMAPYQTKQYELGAKLDLGTFAHTVSVYQVKKPSAYTDPLTQIYGVYGEQRNRGLEWSFFGELEPGLRLLGGASYTKAELTQSIRKENEGNQATGVPKVLAKLGVEYDLREMPGLTLTGNANYAGRRYATDANNLSLPSYTIFDLGARYTLKVSDKPVTLRATVQNVTNKAYWIGSWNGGDGSGLSGGLGTPRSLLFSTSVDF